MLHLWPNFGWNPSKHVENKSQMLTLFTTDINRQQWTELSDPLCVFPAQAGNTKTNKPTLIFQYFGSVGKGQTNIFFFFFRPNLPITDIMPRLQNLVQVCKRKKKLQGKTTELFYLLITCWYGNEIIQINRVGKMERCFLPEKHQLQNFPQFFYVFMYKKRKVLQLP